MYVLNMEGELGDWEEGDLRILKSKGWDMWVEGLGWKLAVVLGLRGISCLIFSSDVRVSLLVRDVLGYFVLEERGDSTLCT